MEGCMAIPGRVLSRISTSLKRFQPILAGALARDVNESDTAVIVTDLLAEVLGYDKYSEITSEYMIRSTFCDLAVKLEGELSLLVEIKAAGLELKDSHAKQAVDYAANQGCEWVALTNGAVWQVYKVIFGKPVAAEQILAFDLLKINHRKDAELEPVWLLSKEGWQKSRLGEYAIQRQALSRFTMAAIVLTDPVLTAVRREIRRVSPDVRINVDQIRQVLTQEVMKREVLEGDKADAARRLVSRASTKALRAAKDNGDTPAAEPAVVVPA
jgi:hypothetical protein